MEIGLCHPDGAGYWRMQLRFFDPASTTDRSPVGGRARILPDKLGTSRLELDRDDYYQAYGEALTRGLFDDEKIRREYAEVRAAIASAGRVLRVVLWVWPEASDLYSLRWELLRDPEGEIPLALSGDVYFSRLMGNTDWKQPRLQAKGKLRALLAVSSPSDLGRGRKYDLAEVEIEQELARARHALRGIETVALGRDESFTVERFEQRLRDGADLVYLVCHGHLKRGKEPWLYLQNEDGTTGPVKGSDLAGRIASLPRRPVLVVLASCESAGDGSSGSPQASLATLLAQAGVPAVLAMQGLISMETVEKALPVFFEELMRDGRIDRALAVARSRVRGRRDAWMPSLTLRLRDGRIWKAPERREDRRVGVPPILPYLCDRSPQEAQLKMQMARHLAELPQRPMVVLVHGHFREAHDKFVERLREDFLPPMLSSMPGPSSEERSIAHFGPRLLADPSGGSVAERSAVLLREVAELICGDEEAGVEEIAERVAEERRPALVELAFNVNENCPLPEVSVLRAWLVELARWRDLVRGQEVLIILRFSWKDEVEPRSRLMFWKKSRDRQVIELMDELAATPLTGKLGFVALPCLTSIGEDDVVVWIDEHARAVLERDRSAEEAEDLDDDLRERVEKLFADGELMPMDQLGRKLRKHLKELLNT